MKEFKKLLEKFNDEECGGIYLYFLHGNELIQLDLVDYSTCVVCGIEDIKSFEFVSENEGIYLELEEKYKGIDSCWIDKNGVQM